MLLSGIPKMPSPQLLTDVPCRLCLNQVETTTRSSLSVRRDRGTFVPEGLCPGLRNQWHAKVEILRKGHNFGGWKEGVSG